MSPRRPNDPKMRVIQDLTTGHESALLLRRCLLDADTETQKQRIPHLLDSIIASFQSSIGVIDDCGGEDVDGCLEISNKSEDSGDSSKPATRGLYVRKGRRGCYKRRKGSQSFTKVVPALADDGRSWRKYGQKVILNAPFPRSYFRCTHKKDLGCLATKQVQRTQIEPPMYTVTYDGVHTCDSAPIPDSADSSSILLSFDSFDNGCAFLGSPDYMLSSEFAPFEGMSSNASSNFSDLDQGLEFMQHEVGNFGICTWELDEMTRLKFEFEEN